MSTAVSTSPLTNQWITVCMESDLLTDAGVCALFNDEQVAIFKDGTTGKVYALSNYDPISGANVLSRGIVGSISGHLVVASPLYKQHFRLDTGECLESDCSVRVYPVRVENGEVRLSSRL